MFELITERLRLIPLNLANLKFCLVSRRFMEMNLGLRQTYYPNDSDSERDLKQAIAELIKIIEKDEKNYLWNTNWEIVLKSENRIIGGFEFQGSPDVNGEVQIGYVIQSSYRRKGYMAEALSCIVPWALSMDGVFSVIAETEKDNIPSSAVLEKIGMKKYKETEKTVFWKTERSAIH